MAKLLYIAQFAPTNGIMLNQPQNIAQEHRAKSYHVPIYESLKRLNYDFFSTSDINHLIEHHDEYDLVWPLFSMNELLFCKYLDLEYIGVAPNINTTSFDKSLSKLLAKQLGLKTGKWIVADKKHGLQKAAPFPGPYFVKPRFSAASFGIDESCICETWGDVTQRAERYFIERIPIIIEEFIEGVEFSVPIVNTTDKKPIVPLPFSKRSDKKGELKTYEQKAFHESGMTRHICQDEYLRGVLQHCAKKYFLQAQPCDYARVDFIVENKSGIPFFLEFEVKPNIGIKSAAVFGLLHDAFSSYDDLIRHIVELGMDRVNKRNK